MAKNTFGSVVKLGPAGGSLTAVAKLTNIEPGGRTREMQDVTTHDSEDGAQEVIPQGTYKNEPFSIEGLWILGSADDDRLIAAIENGELLDYEIIAKASTGTETEAGSCYAGEYKPGALGTDGKQTYSATLHPTGVKTQAATA